MGFTLAHAGPHLDTVLFCIPVLLHVANDRLTSDMRADADGLLNMMLTVEFVLVMHTMKVVMGITNQLSQLLQKKDQDIINAMDQLDVTWARLQALCDNWPELLETVITSPPSLTKRWPSIHCTLVICCPLSSQTRQTRMLGLDNRATTQPC